MPASRDEREPEQAAQDAVDPDRLLPGEDPGTTDSEDVDHWTAVYAELVGFKEEMLATARRHVAAMQGAAAEEVVRTDLEIMEAEAERLRRHLRYWSGRGAAHGD